MYYAKTQVYQKQLSPMSQNEIISWCHSASSEDPL